MWNTEQFCTVVPKYPQTSVRSYLPSHIHMQTRSEIVNLTVKKKFFSSKDYNQLQAQGAFSTANW